MSDQSQSVELWQAFNEQGEPLTDAGLPKSDAARGILHGSAHVWLWRISDGSLSLLFQQRAHSAMTFPDTYDVSAAGHLTFGEAPLSAARRETAEEIGVLLEPARLRLLFVYRQRLPVGDTGIVENELQWVYGVHAPEVQDLKFTDGEVENSRWIDEATLRQILAGQNDLPVVPHGNAYFTNLLYQIKASP